MGNTRQRTSANSAQHTRKEFRQLQQQKTDRVSDRKTQVVDEKGVPYVTEKSSMDFNSVPSAFTAFKALFFIGRVTAGMWSGISDCDETFNYWEPLHYLIYGKGFQTWEYDPQYGLRSYFYILLHTVPAWFYAHFLQPNPMYVFYVTRGLLALICAGCETYFYIGVSKEVGANVGRITLGILIFSAGMFVSSTALLPSTTSMYLCMLSHGAWFQQNYKLAIFFTALSTFVSWPFAALLGLPIACDIVLRKKEYVFFIKWSVISAVIILALQIPVDSLFYGKLVIAPLNIVKYNVLSDHGPDLYGTEPWTYYLFNGLLNFNVAFILALLVWPLQGILHATVKLPERDPEFLPVTLSQLAMYLWLLVFWLQPHKEERFLFPAYPLICLAAALSVDTIQKLWYAFLVKVHIRHYLDHTQWISYVFLAFTTLLSVMRIVALYQNYHASMDIWRDLNHMSYSEESSFKPEDNVNVCMGKEWYRFPSNFFLPSNNWNVKFIKSEFKGQLPQPYLTEKAHATATERPNFNNLNLEELDRYVKDPRSECDFIVDYENGVHSPLEPIFSEDSSQWGVEMSLDFLDASRSHKFFRAFYVPFTRSSEDILGESRCHFGKYVLLKNLKLISSKSLHKRTKKAKSSTIPVRNPQEEL